MNAGELQCRLRMPQLARKFRFMNEAMRFTSPPLKSNAHGEM